MLGASEDGSYLIRGRRGRCPPATKTRMAKPRSPVVTICIGSITKVTGGRGPSSRCSPVKTRRSSWDQGPNVSDENTAFQTARVSPNGEYLAFMSDRSLTWYDNEDVSSAHPGERLDQEVYLYDASTGMYRLRLLRSLGRAACRGVRSGKLR